MTGTSDPLTTVKFTGKSVYDPEFGTHFLWTPADYADGFHHKSKPDTLRQRTRHTLHNWLLRIVEWLDPSVCVICGDEDRMCCVEMRHD